MLDIHFLSCNGLHDRENVFGNLFGKNSGADDESQINVR